MNNAVARIAGLLAVAAVGAVATASFAASLDEQAAHAAADPALGASLARVRDRPLDASVPRELAADAKRLRPMLARASVSALHVGLWSTTALLAIGGLVSAIGITNRRRRR